MRGLTKEEREYLAGNEEASDHEWEVVMPQLRLRGLVALEPLADITLAHTTDLGSLALRVCPIE